MNLNELKSAAGREKFYNMLRYEPGAKKPHFSPKIKSVIFCFMSGVRRPSNCPERTATPD